MSKTTFICLDCAETSETPSAFKKEDQNCPFCGSFNVEKVKEEKDDNST